MEKPFLLHMFTPANNLSPFDVNMAYDAGWSAAIPYTGVSLDEVAELVQDTIFSRGPKGARKTGIFIGGRDMHLAMDMLERAREAMVPPFEVSVFADPSGAFTTSAGMMAAAERQLKKVHKITFERLRVMVFGGTGPVGSACAVLAAKAGADASIVSHSSFEKARKAAEYCSERYGVSIAGVDGSSDEQVHGLLDEADVVFSAARAGVQILSAADVAAAPRLKVAVDVNAVPPSGIEGVGAQDDGVLMPHSPSGALGIGALAVGNLKYQTQHQLLLCMRETENPVYLDFQAASDWAREHAG
jgi:methylene-tetrahydromethanopterin dehydrogenase